MKIIDINKLTKEYKLYAKPIDRLKESLSIKKTAFSKTHYALQDVTLSIDKGEIVGIIGGNGAGKSTLLKIITGVLIPTKGDVQVQGSVSALLELGAGFNPEYTGIENIYLYGAMLNKTKEEMNQEIDGIIKFADIGDFLYQPVKTYSSGMFARLAFSVAINVKPDILIVDEILSVGDFRFQLKCMEKMKEMMSDGTTVLFVAHDMNTIKKFCSRAIWINKGQLIMDGDVEYVTDRYLDFLKVNDIEVVKSQNEEKKQDEFILNKNIVAEIKEFNIIDTHKNKIDKCMYNERMYIEVVYDVHDESIVDPVLGIAIKQIDEEYVCGLNTLLDKVSIPWQIGRNRFYLEYTYGSLAVGGKYYFDVALFDQTATVEIQYISKIKEITINFKYVGEGSYIIPHKWKEDINV